MRNVTASYKCRDMCFTERIYPLKNPTKDKRMTNGRSLNAPKQYRPVHGMLSAIMDPYADAVVIRVKDLLPVRIRAHEFRKYIFCGPAVPREDLSHDTHPDGDLRCPERPPVRSGMRKLGRDLHRPEPRTARSIFIPFQL